MAKTISFLVSAAKYKPFVEVTAEELVFGYDDTLVALAHKFYPRHKRPMSKMGLLVAVSNFLYLFTSHLWALDPGQGQPAILTLHSLAQVLTKACRTDDDMT